MMKLGMQATTCTSAADNKSDHEMGCLRSHRASSLSEKFRNPVFKLENGRFRGKNTVIDDQKPGLWSARRSLRQPARWL